MYSEAAVLIAHTRAGGIFLNHCLSSHPNVFWPRGEPLLPGAEWKRAFPHASDVEILSCIMRAAHYQVGGCKITYEQMGAQRNRAIWMYLIARKAKVIHLTRDNLLRSCISQVITGMVSSQKLKGHAAHTFKQLPPPEVVIPVASLLDNKMRPQKRAIGDMHQKLNKLKQESGLEVLHMTYDWVIGGEGREAGGVATSARDTICDFLGVSNRPLTCELRRVHPYPLSEFVKNWDEVRCAIAKSEFANCLEEEEEYWTQ